jgi:peptidyl-prolyl cis-trans isomerase SurA
MTFRPRHLSLLLAAALGSVAFGQNGTPLPTFGQPPAQAGQPAQPVNPVANPPPTANAADSLNLRFANGIVAIAEDKIITVADVTREIAPLFQQLQAEAKSQKELDERLTTLQDSVIQDLIDRVLIIKDFRKDEKKHIPRSYVENEIANRLSEQFDNDRSKFLAYLRSMGLTTKEFERDVEEDIIYSYMRSQQRKSESIVSPVRIETFYNENKDRFYREDEVHLRLIQLTRNEGENDGDLRVTANKILSRFKAGEKFEDLAKEFSRDAKRAKGGDWGMMRRSDFKSEFSEVAFNLKPGEASEPLVLPEGCFILYVEERKFAGIQPLNEVRDQIERMLIQQMSRVNQERWLERLRRNGYVKHY